MNKTKTEKVNLAQVKEHLSAYVTKAEAGDTVVVCRRNRPAAQLVPVDDAPSENRTRLGSAKGSVAVKCELTEPAVAETDWDVLS